LIVVDTNIIAYFLIESEYSAAAQDVCDRDSSWAAPHLWRSEMRSILAGHLRRGAVSLAAAQEYMSDATLLLNGREHDAESNRVLELADLSGCTAYDCEFVHVAEKLRLPLVTSDKQILRSFPEIAISMQDFLVI
jgi:predicted nucleic acid-binding protein